MHKKNNIISNNKSFPMTFLRNRLDKTIIVCFKFNSILYIYIYIYLFHTQSTHIDKSYINSNTIIHRINDKYIIMPGHITVNKILKNNHK